MPAVRLTPRLRAMWKIHRFLLRASRSRMGSRLGSLKVLLLARFVDADPAYGECTERTTREIPVFELRPEGS